jgi:hypothetical protein
MSSMSSPSLMVETIAFHGHDPNALPLEAGGAAVTCAEFVRTSRSLPAAYVAPAADGHVTIRATLFSQDLAGQTVEVCGSRLDGAGHAIQDVECRPVTFDASGHSGGIDFSVVMLRLGIDLDHVRWQWRFEHNGEFKSANITAHQIAIVLATPEKPWTTGTPTSDTTVPLWEVLQHACTVARGAGTLREAAVRITKAVFGLWGGQYYRWDPFTETFASDIGSPLAFDCIRFLGLISAQPPAAREKVDCSDVATILSTFASILGCPIQQIALKELLCNEVKLVGHDEPVQKDFPLHEIAVSVPMASDPEVWDGCLLVSGDEPIGPDDSEILPAGLRGTEYIDRLLRLNERPFDGTLVHVGPLSRPLRPLSNLLPTPMWNAHLEKIAADYGFQSWDDPDPSVVPIFDPMTVVDDGWRVLIDTVFPSPESLDPGVDAVARMACAWHNDPRRHVRVTVYLCADADAARLRLLYLLGKFGERLMPLDTGRDVAFSTPDQKTIVGATKNVAYKIIDAGESPDVSGPDALRLRATLTKTLENTPPPL